MDINATIARFKKLDFRDIIENSMIDTSTELARLQRFQMLLGKQSDGISIGRYKNPAYARKKAAMNPLAKGSVDLKLTGKFYREIFADVRDNSIVFSSADNTPLEDGIGKTDKLVGMYGEDIFGLSVPFRIEYSQNYLKPEAMKRIKNLIYGM